MKERKKNTHFHNLCLIDFYAFYHEFFLSFIVQSSFMLQYSVIVVDDKHKNYGAHLRVYLHKIRKLPTVYQHFQVQISHSLYRYNRQDSLRIKQMKSLLPMFMVANLLTIIESTLLCIILNTLCKLFHKKYTFICAKMMFKHGIFAFKNNIELLLLFHRFALNNKKKSHSSIF